MKIYDMIKLIICITLGVIIFVFNEPFIEQIHYLVGSIMILLGIEDMTLQIIHNEIKEEISKTVDNILSIMFGIIRFFLNQPENFVSVCIIWSTWTILREEWEIEQKAILGSKSLAFSIINIAESITIIVFAILFIFHPNKEHAHIHIIILGIELILEVVFPILDNILGKYFPRKNLTFDAETEE